MINGSGRHELAAVSQQRPVEVGPFFYGALDDAILLSAREAEAEVIWRDASCARRAAAMAFQHTSMKTSAFAVPLSGPAPG